MSEYPSMMDSLKAILTGERELWEMRSAWVEKFFGPFTPMTEEELTEAMKPEEKYQEYRDDLLAWQTEEERLAFEEKWKEYLDEREEYRRDRPLINWHEQFKQEEKTNE